MNYKSILPDGYVPSRECVDWLRNEQQRLFDAHSKAFHQHFERPALDRVFARDEWEHVQTLGRFAQLVFNAYRNASDRWINQHAFDWMKEGDF